MESERLAEATLSCTGLGHPLGVWLQPFVAGVSRDRLELGAWWPQPQTLSAPCRHRTYPGSNQVREAFLRQWPLSTSRLWGLWEICGPY